MSEAPSLTSYLVFNTVAKRGNLSAAAKELLISQPAVSRSLSKLEEGLSVKLFIRNSRGVRLTEEGAILYEHTKTAFDSLEQARKSIERISSLDTGTLGIGADTFLCGALLMPKLREFLKLSPNMNPKITLGSSTDIMKKVENGELDVGLISRPPSLHRLQYLETARLTDTFVASGEYLEKLDKAGENLQIKDYMERSTIFLPETGSAARRQVDMILELNGIVPSYVTDVDSPVALREFALSGAGIAAIPKEFVAEDLDAGTLRELPLSANGAARSVGLCYEKTALQSTALNRFLSVYK